MCNEQKHANSHCRNVMININYICSYLMQTIFQQEEEKMKVGQLTNDLSEMNSQLIVKEQELTKLKEDNKLLAKQFRDRKKKRRETIAQVCYY